MKVQFPFTFPCFCIQNLYKEFVLIFLVIWAYIYEHKMYVFSPGISKVCTYIFSSFNISDAYSNEWLHLNSFYIPNHNETFNENLFKNFNIKCDYFKSILVSKLRYSALVIRCESKSKFNIRCSECSPRNGLWEYLKTPVKALW